MRHRDPRLGPITLLPRWAVVTGSDDRRVDEPIYAVRWNQELRVRKLHPNVIARQYVADVHLEDVLALLLQQHGGLSFGFAVSYSARAVSFSRISAVTRRSPIRALIACTAARVDAGNT